MARRTFDVVDVTAILIHWHAGRSQSQIAASLGLDRKTVKNEKRFVVTVRDHIPNYAIPNGRYATDDDDVLASGYQACAALDQYPNNAGQATRTFYARYGYPPRHRARAVHPLARSALRERVIMRIKRRGRRPPRSRFRTSKCGCGVPATFSTQKSPTTVSALTVPSKSAG